MDLENTAESVNSGKTFPMSTETFAKAFNIPSKKFAYNAITICDSSPGIKCNEEILSNSDSESSDEDSSFESESNCSKSPECDQEPKGIADTQSSDNVTFRDLIKHSPNSTSEDSNSHLSKKCKVTDTKYRDTFEYSSESSDSKNVCDDSVVDEEQTRPVEEEQAGPVEEEQTRPEVQDFGSHDNRRTRRNSKRKRDADECCPVCGVTVRLPELENHFSKEVENLSKIHKNLKKPRPVEQGISTTFVQVKSNRENRLSAKVAKYAAKYKSEACCPVCHLKVTGSKEDINNHVLSCINEGDESDELLVVDEESFEEYEFGDQTRVRAISFIHGGYRSLHGNSSKPKTEDDEDLNVDVDDTMTYGEPQYTELDVIHNKTDTTEVKELEQLRNAVLLDPTAQPHVLESRKWTTEKRENSRHISDPISLPHEIESPKWRFVDDFEEGESSKQAPMEDVDHKALHDKAEIAELTEKLKRECLKKEYYTQVSIETFKNLQDNQVISSLKEKIKDLEEQNTGVKCLICLEPYTKPVVSTTCWHVHCEECWLMTMGVKKLCPQCNMIVFPSDLRRIFL